MVPIEAERVRCQPWCTSSLMGTEGLGARNRDNSVGSF